MKKLALIVTAALIATPAMAADPVVGTWQTAKDDNGNYGHIEVAPVSYTHLTLPTIYSV